MPTDLYDVLGAPADASAEELKRSYRSRVREYHPDVNDHPESDQQFKLIQVAHDVLSNPADRKDYDRMTHREFVDTRLDDVPPVSVFPEAESAAVDGPGGTETTTDSASSGATADRETGRTSTASATESATRQSTTSGQTADRRGAAETDRSGESTAAQPGDATSTGWQEATESTAYQTGTGSTTPSAAARRRRGLSRWYGVVLASLLTYLVGLGDYAAQHAPRLAELLGALADTPVATLAGVYPLPAVSTYVLTAVNGVTAGAAGPGLLLLFGVVLLPIVTLTAVAQFGQGIAWGYALASLGPVLCLAAQAAVPLQVGVVILGLVLLPLFSGLGFLIDVGRYLWATR